MGRNLRDFVEGVYVEVLWDVERTTVEGRRQGERVVESVWWKGEVLEVNEVDGKTTAKIRYESLGEFDSQVGEVHVFPGHMLIAGEGEITQLRWRYYESSGNISYNPRGIECDNDYDMPSVASSDSGHNLRIKFAEVLNRVEQVERIFVSQRSIFSDLSNKITNEERCYNHVVSLLRQKLATAVQKPIVAYKHRNGNTEAGDTLFDFSCAGSLRIQVDCSVEEFENVCAVVKTLTPSAYFRVDGHHFVPITGCLNASTGVGEILFHSLSQLCEGIGVSQERDILCIAQRERKQGKNGSFEDAAIRIAGSFLADGDKDGSPSAILVCRGLHDGVSVDEQFDVLTRENRELDTRTVWYSKPLRSQSMTLSSLIRFLYPKASYDFPSKANQLAMSSDMSSFALRWKPLPNPNPKIWTRSMLIRPDFAGLLEFDIPYVMIRGARGIKEMHELVTTEYVRKQLS